MSTIPQGDPSAQFTYAAVGEALSAWESMESALSVLYSCFIEQAGEMDAYREYGKEGRIFSERLRVIENAAAAFAIRFPDQRIEGDFRQLLKDLCAESLTRHRIAHGFVRDIPDGSDDPDQPITSRFYLTAPWFAEGRLKTDALGTASIEIAQHTMRFRELERRICVMAEHLTPQSWP
jgi:hypothetical protein